MGRFSSGLVGLLGDLVQGFVSLDDDGCSHVSRRLDTDLRAISSATRNMAKPSPARCTCQSESPGKKNMDESDTDRDTDENDGDESDDDFMVLYHGSSSRSGAADVDITHSGDANAEVRDSVTENVEGIPDSVAGNVDPTQSSDANAEARNSVAGNVEGISDRGGDEPVIESQIMLTGTSNTVSSSSGDGVLSQHDMTDTQFGLATESSVKSSGAQLAKNLAYMRRRKKLKLPSPPRSAPPPEPVQLSERDIHLSVMKVVVQELGIRVADKGTGEVIRPSTGTKQVSCR